MRPSLRVAFPILAMLVVLLSATCLLLTSPLAAHASKIVPAGSIRNPIPAGRIVGSPADFNSLRSQAYAAGRTKVAPPSSSSSSSLHSPRIPASNCWHCLPGSDECYDMCEYAGDRWAGCPRCITCYNPDVPEDVARCAEDRCRDRDAFNSCIGWLNAGAAGQCLRLLQPSAVLACAGTKIGLGAAKVVPCYLWHCVPW